jgi:hypothetical protein
MRLNTFSIALILVVVAAGCGSNKSATKTASTTTTSSSGGGSTVATSTTSSSSSGGTASFASAKNCLQLATVGQKFSQAMAVSSGAGKTDLTTVANAYKAMADAAPTAIRSDFQTIAAAFSSYISALKKAGYTPGKLPTAAQMAGLTSAAKSFSDPKLQTAEQHLSSWAGKNCHG